MLVIFSNKPEHVETPMVEVIAFCPLDLLLEDIADSPV